MGLHISSLQCSNSSLPTKGNYVFTILGLMFQLIFRVKILGMSLVIFPGGSDGEESACNSEDLALIPGLARFPEEGNG